MSLPYLPLALGGASDSKPLVGTARGWATVDASPIIRKMADTRCASMLALLGKMDKIARRYEGGSIDAQLLGLLEPETASRWRDRYLQITCDLSRVSFGATADSLSAIKKPLLSRVHPLQVPAPGPEHLPAVAAGITRDLEAQWKLSAGTTPRPFGKGNKVSLKYPLISFAMRVQYEVDSRRCVV